MSLTALFPVLDDPIPTTAGGTLAPDTDFEVLALALDAAGLTTTVAGLGDNTLFAPTDAAFADLATALGFTGDTSDADAVFGAIAGALTELAPGDDPIPLLTDILLYHVAPGEQTLADLAAAGPVDTLLAEGTVQIAGDAVIDADPDAANADIIAADLDAGGVTVQVVDSVLLPLDTPVEGPEPTLTEILEESGGAPDDDNSDFDLLLTALQATGLDVAADDPDAELTVFLPNDQAFINLAQDLGYEGEDEAGALETILMASAEADPDNPLALVSQVLQFHISPGEQDAEAVLGAEEIATLQGTPLAVDGMQLIDQDADAATATLIATDIEAGNGIAHVIDEVLLPVDLAAADGAPGVPEDDPEPEPIVEDDDGGSGDIALGILGIFLLSLGLGGGLAFF
ncbi:MAG: fasciclin domain-containing protein [Pseudomonadota bacterium]